VYGFITIIEDNEQHEKLELRHGFTLWQGAGEIPPNLSLPPKSFVTAAVCSSKTF